MLHTKRTINLWSIAAAGVLLAVAMLAGRGVLADNAAKMMAIGQAAPTFSLVNAETGNKISLDADRQGKKATVLIFISNRCPVSNAYNDRMIVLADKYGPQGATFIGINSNEADPIAEIAADAQTNKFPFPVLKDSDDSVADAYNARCTPTAYVIDAQGVLVYHGRIDNSQDPAGVTTHELSDAITDVLAGRPVSKPETKAFGCGIKRMTS